MGLRTYPRNKRKAEAEESNISTLGGSSLMQVIENETEACSCQFRNAIDIFNANPYRKAKSTGWDYRLRHTLGLSGKEPRVSGSQMATAYDRFETWIKTSGLFPEPELKTDPGSSHLPSRDLEELYDILANLRRLDKALVDFSEVASGNSPNRMYFENVSTSELNVDIVDHYKDINRHVRTLILLYGTPEQKAALLDSTDAPPEYEDVEQKSKEHRHDDESGELSPQDEAVKGGSAHRIIDPECTVDKTSAPSSGTDLG